ncbi:hypothetical protein SLS58_002863 [Diplodia intermedia]|uniref:Condensation domain-containing protein n=1 Tax=Diplodia intermedia TaxID=856260 RepID=A0ABR3TYM6_9PEZI
MGGDSLSAMKRPRWTEPTAEYNLFSESPGDVDTFLRDTLAVGREVVKDVIEATSVHKAMTEAAMSPQQGTINHVWLHFTGPINTQRVNDDCFQVLARHSILRTVFVPYNTQQLMQIVFGSHQPEWEKARAAPGGVAASQSTYCAEALLVGTN